MSDRATNDELTDWADRAGVMQSSMADSMLRSIVDELIERRALDLSPEDVKWLGLAKAMLRESVRGCMQHPDYVAKAVAVLDKLLGGKP